MAYSGAPRSGRAVVGLIAALVVGATIAGSSPAGGSPPSAPGLPPAATQVEPPPGSTPYDEIPPAGPFDAFTGVQTWNHTDLTYFFVNRTSDIAGDGERQAMRSAFALWQNSSRLTFREVTSAAAADIEILFASGNHGDGIPFDGANGRLAHTFYPPPTGGSTAGDAHFDEGETWTVNTSVGGQPIDLLTVAAHEFGHAIGLGHSDDPDALMYAFYSGSHRFLGTDDVRGINALYPNVSAPANDDFAAATPLTGGWGVASGSNAGATGQSGEPVHAGEPGGKSVWFRWTAPVTGTATFHTFGSNFDTLLAAYTGGAVTALSPVPNGANDDAAGTQQSRIDFPATGGTTYRIAVDGWGGLSGSIELRWALVPPTSATAPTVAPTPVAAGNTGASGAASVWYGVIPASGNGGSPVTKYRATCRASGRPDRLAEDTAAPFHPITVTGMANGVTYSCRVRAHNAVGAGPESVGGSVRVGAPSAPPSVTNARGSANGSINVTWTAATTPAGAPLTGHTVTCAAAGSSKTANLGGSARAATLSGLDRTKTYVCSVRATNKFGTGPPRSGSAGTKPR